jgi:carboxylesterase type B
VKGLPVRSIVSFLKDVREDLNAYRAELANQSPTMNVGALIEFHVNELKSLLAKTGGRPPRAYSLYDDVYELEFIRGRVWVRFALTQETRSLARITVLGWNRFPHRS